MKALLFVVLMLAGTPSMAQNQMTGIRLLEICNAQSEGCIGYVTAVLDSHSLLATPKSQYYCPPSGATNGQAELIVKKWLTDNPQRLHESAALLVLIAMSNAFPCKQ